MAKKTKDIEFNTVIKNKKIPILTLDARWHELFPEDLKTAQIKELEQKVNSLLKKQGKMVNDIKDMKKLKNNLMQEIMVNMDVGNDNIGKAKEKKLDQNKQFINELNDKINQAMDELSDIPYQIKEMNEELMLESMNICYDNLKENHQEIAKIAAWIGEIRDELKNKILAKQDMETRNTQIYTYMHDILGAELAEVFDKKFDYHSKP